MPEDILFRALFPARYIPEPQPIKFEQIVIINWLDIEIEQQVTKRLPILGNLSGHRNRDVFFYVKSTNAFWDDIIAEMYV